MRARLKTAKPSITENDPRQNTVRRQRWCAFILQIPFSLMADNWLILLSLLLIRSPNVATATDNYQSTGRGVVISTIPAPVGADAEWSRCGVVFLTQFDSSRTNACAGFVPT